METGEKPWSLGLSVVVPVFNEEGSVGELARRLTAVLDGTGSTYEVIFVDDGTKDRTLSPHRPRSGRPRAGSRRASARASRPSPASASATRA